MNPRRLYRSADDRILAGVCAGLADYFDMDPAIVRVVWFLSVFLSGSLTFWAYIVMIFVVPVEPDEWPAGSPWAPGAAPFGYPAQPGAPVVPGAAAEAAAGGSSAADASAGGGAGAPGGDPGVAAGTAPTWAMPGVPGPAAGGAWTTDWRSIRRQQRMQRRAERHHERTPALVFGLLLILVGGLLAWHQIDPHFDLGLTGPIVVIAFGALLIVTSIRPNRGDQA